MYASAALRASGFSQMMWHPSSTANSTTSVRRIAGVVIAMISGLWSNILFRQLMEASGTP